MQKTEREGPGTTFLAFSVARSSDAVASGMLAPALVKPELMAPIWTPVAGVDFPNPTTQSCSSPSRPPFLTHESMIHGQACLVRITMASHLDMASLIVGLPVSGPFPLQLPDLSFLKHSSNLAYPQPMSQHF